MEKRHDGVGKAFLTQHGMRCKSDLIFLKVLGLVACSVTSAVGADAPEPIYRCGNEYTNAPAQARDCQVIQSPSITVIPGTRPFGASAVSASTPLATRTKTTPAGAPALGAPSAEPGDAQNRDAQKRTILVTELQHTRERHAQMVLEYNEGQPDKVGGEARNHQKYLDRLAHLKAGIARAERDMDSLQRELSRMPLLQGGQP